MTLYHLFLAYQWMSWYEREEDKETEEPINE
jgi:hypothetical protein